MDPVLNVAIRAAREAGRIIMNHADRLDTVEISEKEGNDLVTSVDRLAERAIIDILSEAYPEHAFLGEEGTREETQNVEGDHLWIIDPLDGTANYVHGFPHYAISIAFQEKGRTRIGLIYDPVRDELFTAERGGGAYLNRRRMRCSKCRLLNKALVATGFPFREKEQVAMYTKTFQTVMENTAGIRRAGSAALDLAYVAAGRLDGFWEFNLRPWDIAAGMLLVIEAGGRISDFEGGDTMMDKGNVLAAGPDVFKTLLQTVNKALPPK